ncbi:MAG: hypothetical protein IIX08_03035 [Bacteroidales bacterium]|nr:hypothetical protein [Bacteroidales bacterium]
MILSAVALTACLSLSAQNKKSEEKDSLVVLLSSKSAQMVDIEGARYRKVVGPARFLHNNTYLICDTALWNVETKIIDAWGNVSVLQEETVLTSENLKYLIDEDLVQFRGAMVQLTDKDHNTLRTRHLDYNTKDSVAVFMNGGAMRDKDGQIIESRTGTYDSKINTFTFNNDVNMFTDSVFVKTKELVYESDLDLATFGSATDVWKDENMLSSNRGWYDRGRELFFFADKVHVMSEDQEAWCDTLFFHRSTSDIEMLGNTQITDTTRNVFALAGRVEYIDTLSKVTLTRKPAVISQTEDQNGAIDTVYLGADRLVYYTQMKFEISDAVNADADKRLKSLEVDPVGEFRRKAAEAAAKAAEEEAKKDPNYRPKASKPKGNAAPPEPTGRPTRVAPSSGGAKPNPQTRPQRPTRPERPERPEAPSSNGDIKTSADQPAAKDSLSVKDSLSIPDSLAMPDSLAVTDSLAVADSLDMTPKDSTRIGFLQAVGKVKIYKKDIQVACDSLLYCDLDSLARLYKEPLIWQEITRQYSADSVTLMIKDGKMQKASLMSNAFIVIKEDEKSFDQIKGTEMLAYFGSEGELVRFDVLGGASALFYLEENGVLATVNKPESKMLSAVLKDGEIQRIYYFEEAKNDGYPVVQMTADDKQLKGFNWLPERRPADRKAVTPLSLRPSERLRYAAHPRAKYKQTDIYFPGYMNDVYRQIEVRDSLRRVREWERQSAEQEAAEKARLDSLAVTDSLATGTSLTDSLSTGPARLPVSDSLSVSRDSLSAHRDSLATGLDSLALSDSLAVKDSIVVTEPTKEELRAAAKAEKARIKAEKKAARELKRQERQAAKEARWAELDKRDAEKAAAKEAKLKAKERERKRKALEDAARQAEKDAQTLEKYRRKFEEQKANEAAKASGRKAQNK